MTLSNLTRSRDGLRAEIAAYCTLPTARTLRSRPGLLTREHLNLLAGSSRASLAKRLAEAAPDIDWNGVLTEAALATIDSERQGEPPVRVVDMAERLDPGFRLAPVMADRLPVKDLYRRREMYWGNVTARRGVEVLPGRHPAILTDEEYADAVAGVESRKRHIGAKPTFARRTYARRGLIRCSCGARMRGGHADQPRKGLVLLACPVADGRHQLGVDGQPVECHARRVPAREAERVVVGGL